MALARESAEVISRECRSCPEAIWIWFKWKFAIDRFCHFSLPLCVFRQHPVLRACGGPSRRALNCTGGFYMRGQSTRGESDDHDHRTPKFSQGRKCCRSIDGCACRRSEEH